VTIWETAGWLPRGGSQDLQVGRVPGHGLGHDVAQRVRVSRGGALPETIEHMCLGLCDCRSKPCHGGTSRSHGLPVGRIRPRGQAMEQRSTLLRKSRVGAGPDRPPLSSSANLPLSQNVVSTRALQRCLLQRAAVKHARYDRTRTGRQRASTPPVDSGFGLHGISSMASFSYVCRWREAR